MNADPTARISLDLAQWIASRERKQSSHLTDGVPDYAFSLDLTVRRQLEGLGPLRAVASALNAGTVPIQRALHEVRGVAVSPRQLPQIHAMGVACAERLGIGVPQIFIIQDPTLNGFTFATNDVDQIIVLTSGLVGALEPVELQFVIGHECGHIHNRHVVYNTLWELLTNVLARRIFLGAMAFLGPAAWVAQLLAAAFTISTLYIFGRWHRCAEITCDRAGLLCVRDLKVATDAFVKLAVGSKELFAELDQDAYFTQLEDSRRDYGRMGELHRSHPDITRRIEALRAFAESALYRGATGRDGGTDRAELERRTEAIVKVM